MQVFTKIDKELYNKLAEISDRKDFIEFVFDFCESQKDRKRILDYIDKGHHNRIEILLMSSQVSIENGNSEGELIDAEESE